MEYEDFPFLLRLHYQIHGMWIQAQCQYQLRYDVNYAMKILFKYSVGQGEPWYEVVNDNQICILE